MSKQESMIRINQILTKIRELLVEAESIADDEGLSFRFNPSGAYGAGAKYTGASIVDEWEASEYDVSQGDGFWVSSSQNC